METRATLGNALLLTVLAGVLALPASANEPRPVALDDVLYGIGQVETGGRQVGLHKDGVSYGVYGVTYMAVRELQRLRLLDDGEVNLASPATNRKVAALYLSHLRDRYGTWEKAVEMYNPMAKDYAPRVWAIVHTRTRAVAAASPDGNGQSGR
ncbi:MAG: hypothetical protein BWZ02_00315 [Lentisphaerae bacterium ADurb.BinA184]|nr:MAG: hypothetical protein BWZ02_00315 [Lentisphaerae bacterium ADurb.BinA184]